MFSELSLLDNLQEFTLESGDIPPKLSICKPKIKKLMAIGNLDLLQQKTLAIVGSRLMSQYADQVLEAFFEQARGKGFATISGLARGVDQKCHILSLKFGIPTIAVLGGGIRRFLKTSERNLIREILESDGLILSEYDLDFEPTKWSFPMRNRIIAGLSDVVFLPEAREGSGSLITAKYALEMKKPVLIAPNHLFATNAQGSNQWLSAGKGQMISSFSQVLDFFEGDTAGLQKDTMDEILNSLTENEKTVFQLVQNNFNQELSSRNLPVELDLGSVMMQLTMLEIKGIIRQSGPGMYTLK